MHHFPSTSELLKAAAVALLPTRIDTSPPLTLGLKHVSTVLWATGYRPNYSWLEVPVLDRKGRIRRVGGAADAPGLYVLGLPFLRRRKSSLIDDVGDDARELAAHLAAYLDGIDFDMRSTMSGGTKFTSSVVSASTSST